MASSAVASVYAKALADLTAANGSMSAVRDQLDSLAGLVRASRELQVVLSNPTVGVDARKRVVVAVSDRLSLSKTTRSFLLVLAEKNRLAALAPIADAFGQLVDERSGIVRAKVVSSVALSEAQATRLRAVLGDLTGKSVVVSNETDPAHIGGLAVHVGGKVYDSTVATQLDKLRAAILQRI